MVDLLVRGADLVATMDEERREIPGGWVAVSDGLVSAIGASGEVPPDATTVLRAEGCLVTPGLVNTHHHIYQNLTRAYRPATVASLFDWLTTLYPRWSRLDEEAAYVSAWIGLAELALGGCTTSTDHLYVHPRGAGDLITAEIRAELDVNMKSIELGNREALQALEEASRGANAAPCPFAADNLPADWKAAIKVRQDYLSGVLHFPHAIRFLGAVEFLQSTARTFE